MPSKKFKFVILDDDPTGIQTVHGCLLLTCWEPEYLINAFQDKIPFFYILTNSRAYSSNRAKKIISEIMENIISVNKNFCFPLVFISRSDSTLRSHFPLEINIIIHFWENFINKTVDAIFMVPAFFEANRITYHNIHYIRTKTVDLPTDQTEFAKDSLFGYSSSLLPSYIEEKTKGKIKANQVHSIPLSWLENNSNKELSNFLTQLKNKKIVIVNATNYEHLANFSRVVLATMEKGKIFLFQSAASLVKSLTKNPDQPLLDKKIITRKGPGLFIIGSYVQHTTLQLEELIKEKSIIPLEISIENFLSKNNYQNYLIIVKEKIIKIMNNNQTPVVFTSRAEIFPQSKEKRISLGQKISIFLSELVKKLPILPSYLVAKGGITAHQILAYGLEVKQSRVLGQILPGVPVISLPENHQYPSLPYIIFPGNVGDKNALINIFNILN